MGIKDYEFTNPGGSNAFSQLRPKAQHGFGLEGQGAWKRSMLGTKTDGLGW
jgi:hypothetical protein